MSDTNSIEFRLQRPAQPSANGTGLKADENSIDASKTTPKKDASRTPRHTEAVPDSVLERFIKVGNHFYFPDGAEAFADQGNKMTTRSENTVVIQSMVAIARERAKGEISVKGTEFFRKEAWFAAKLAGLEVRGYEPSQLEQERLVRAIARRQEISREAPEVNAGTSQADGRPVRVDRSHGEDPVTRAAPAQEEWLVGRLVDHGPARFGRNDKNPMNYYVRLETAHGDVERWGVDLERAFRQSLSRPGLGDEVALRVVGQEAVTVRATKRDAQGREIGQEDLDTHRNQWIVERKDFIEHRQKIANAFRDPNITVLEAAKIYPELGGSALQLRMGEALAEEQYKDAQHRKQFVNHLREYLAKMIESGKPLEPVPLRDRSDKTPTPEQVKDRDYLPTR